jgi:hypothetical protein
MIMPGVTILAGHYCLEIYGLFQIHARLQGQLPACPAISLRQLHRPGKEAPVAKESLCNGASSLFLWFTLIEDILFASAIPPHAR